MITYVRFRNVSRSSCLLAGYPQVVATQAGRPDVTGTNGSFFEEGHAANMAPGGVTVLGLETDTYCAARPGGGGGGDIYQHVSIALPGGAVSLTVSRSMGLDLTCGLHLTRFSDPRYRQPESVNPLAGLRAVLELPRTAKAGSVLHFIVELQNPTARRVSLTPCPGYVESARTSTASKETYALNCAPVRAIDAHRTVRFAMRLHLPADATAGPAEILWGLQSGDTFGSATVLITG